jgi:hypothetical protein
LLFASDDGQNQNNNNQSAEDVKKSHSSCGVKIIRHNYSLIIFIPKNQQTTERTKPLIIRKRSGSLVINEPIKRLAKNILPMSLNNSAKALFLDTVNLNILK